MIFPTLLQESLVAVVVPRVRRRFGLPLVVLPRIDLRISGNDMSVYEV
jgi:hypothetical protein